ncbi:MAG: hypothetical protein AAF825_02620, partial [Pseudomonadota bacterium]
MIRVSRMAAALALGIAGLGAGSAAACPSAGAAGLGQFSIQEDELVRGVSFALNAGGTTALQGCPIQASGGPTSGLFLTPPHVSINLTDVAVSQVLVATRTQNDCDTLLLVRTPDGAWFWNDNSRTLDARLLALVGQNG